MSNDLIIHSVNIGQNHSSLSSLLQLTAANVVLIQEPSWVLIVPGTSDLHPEGIEHWGTINHPLWEAYIPSCTQPFAPDNCPHVVTFVHKSLLCSYSISSIPLFDSFCTIAIEITVLDQGNLGPDGTSVSANRSTTDVPPPGGARETRGAIMAVATGCRVMAYAPLRAPEVSSIPDSPNSLPHASPSQALCLINFYHYTSTSPPLFHPLFLPPIDHCIPHLLAGDFNTHSPTWSPSHTKTSPWHDTLELWFDQEGFVSMVPKGTITWQHPHHCGSLLDLLLLNEAALAIPAFPCTCAMSFKYSYGSDHTGLSITIPLARTTPPPSLPSVPWHIDDLQCPAWEAAFVDIPDPIIMDIPSLHSVASSIITIISTLSDCFFDPCGPRAAKGLPWWNEACSTTAGLARLSHSNDRRALNAALHLTIRDAKRAWIESLLNDPDTSIWNMAKWQHGRHHSWIPPLTTASSSISADPPVMVTIFQDRFFNLPHTASSPPPLPFPPFPTTPFLPVSSKELSSALITTLNNSAPGPPGIPYRLLKWCFAARPTHLLTILSCALELGHHPWLVAKVIIIPKPHKPEYAATKAYHPISLLECFGKLLEKIVANHLSSDALHHDLLTPMQFARACHLVSNAACLLQYKVQESRRVGMVGAILLFDISHFFDHLDPSLTLCTLTHLGVDGTM